MPRAPKPLPPNRADFSFGDLLYFHLFRQGTRAKGPHAPWELDNICTLTGFSERVLRNWIAGQNLPNNFPSQLADELFNPSPEGQADRAELLAKFEQGWVKRREGRAASPSAITPPDDAETAENPYQSSEEFGKNVESASDLVVATAEGVVSDPPTEPATIPELPPVKAPLPRPARSWRVPMLAAAVIVLGTVGAISLWRSGETTPGQPSSPPSSSTPPGLIAAPTANPNFVQVTPAPQPVPSATPVPPPSEPAAAPAPNAPSTPVALPPAKTGAALFAGTWHVATLSAKTNLCDNPAREMNIKIDTTGQITDMCVWIPDERRCSPSYAAHIRNRTVNAAGDFDFSYIMIPRVGPQREHRLRGTMKDKAGTGMMFTWQDGSRTSCPAAQFTAARLD